MVAMATSGWGCTITCVVCGGGGGELHAASATNAGRTMHAETELRIVILLVLRRNVANGVGCDQLRQCP
jgi:hypothetical protein